MSNYQVLFNGVVVEGRNDNAVMRAVAGELGIDKAKAARLFNGRTVVLASQLSRDEALDLQARLEKVGAVSRIKDLTPRVDSPPDYAPDRADGTLRDLTAAHIDCPRCGHMQLDATHCARCGVDLEAMFRKRRKEELLMEKKLRDHRAAQLREQQGEPAEQPEGAPIIPEADSSPHRAAPKGGLFSRLFKRSA